MKARWPGITSLAFFFLFTLGCQGETSPVATSSVEAPGKDEKSSTMEHQDGNTKAEEKAKEGGETNADPINHVNEATRTEVHPEPQAEEKRPPENEGHTCDGYQSQEVLDPLPFIGTIKGSQIIHTPKGSKPPWQMIFSKDYVAVQGVASWSSDGLLAVCSGTDELILVDAKKPQKTSLIGSLRPSAEMDVLEPKKGIAYSVLGSPFGGAEAPNKYGRCEHIAREGNTLYFSHRRDQFRHHGYVMAYDLAKDPPEQIAYRSEKGESYSGLAITDGGVAVAAHTDGVILLNHELKEVGRYSQISNAWDVAHHRGTLFVASGTEGLIVLDISQPEKPVQLGKVSLPGFAKKVEKGPEKSVFVALGPAGFGKISVKRPSKPKPLFIQDTPGTAVDLSVKGHQVAVADWTSLRVFDGKGKKAVLLGAERTGGEMKRALAVEYREDVIFVGDWTGVHMFKPQLEHAAPHESFDRGIGHFMPSAESGEDHSLTVDLRNDGRKTLNVHSLGTRGAGFQASQSGFSLAPGKTRTLELTFNQQAGGEKAKGELVLCTNGPDGPEVTLPLRANPPRFGAGKPIPDIGLRTTNKEEWILSDQLGKPVLLTYFATF